MSELIFSNLPFNEAVIYDSPKKQDDGKMWSRLAAKDLQTLHEFAAKIGITKNYFYDTPGMPQYVFNSAKIKVRAGVYGALKVSSNYLEAYLKKHYGQSVAAGK